MAVVTVAASLTMSLACRAPQTSGPSRSRTNITIRRGGPETPCTVPTDATAALGHARDIWTGMGRTPYDDDTMAACVRRSFEAARAPLTIDASFEAEVLAFELANAESLERRRALQRYEALLDTALTRGDSTIAEHLFGDLALAIWDRAQRMLERPREIGWQHAETKMHDLAADAPRTVLLPAMPRTSPEFGESEAEWAARLFERAAWCATDAASRSKWHRLALAPWVVLERWRALDSASHSMLARAPRDSALLPAVALAAYHQIRMVVSEPPIVMALFDSAMRAMPRSDSVRYDAFDEVLAQRDDEWRRAHAEPDRTRLDTRGWKVLDPVWSTEVNEVRLARRARVAEADYRFADIAEPGRSGSETEVGRMLLRRGAPDPRWQVARVPGLRAPQLRRGWRGFVAQTEFEPGPDAWRDFYDRSRSLASAASWPLPAAHPLAGPLRASLARDASFADGVLGTNSDWSGIPFYGMLDTIDVSVARFRAAETSADLVISARVPLRRFRPRDGSDARTADRIDVSTWITTSTGDLLFHATSPVALPRTSEIAASRLWTSRVSAGEVMHRVEALEAGRPTAARGATVLNADADASFDLSGFGLSDLLVAESAVDRVAAPVRWSDFTLTPNGAVVDARVPFAMLWETYGLAVAPDGRMRWRVEIRRELGRHVDSSTVRAVLANAVASGERLVPNEPTAPAVSYTRDMPAADAIVDKLQFNLGGASPGRHVVRVTVVDLVSNRSVSRTVGVRVLPRGAQRRDNLNAQ